MERAEAAEGAGWLQWRKVLGRSIKDKGREKRESHNEDSEEMHQGEGKRA